MQSFASVLHYFRLALLGYPIGFRWKSRQGRKRFGQLERRISRQGGTVSKVGLLVSAGSSFHLNLPCKTLRQADTLWPHILKC